MVEPVRIGLIGCGVISAAYLRAARVFDVLSFIGCADINSDASAQCEDRFNVKAMTVDELLRNDEIEVVLNLTIPNAHASVNVDALSAGKHAYCEKPFGLTVAEGRTVLEMSAAKNLRVGCAPDTFLGGGHQTVRHLIDANTIGKPIAGTAFMMGHGHESWHPAPEFYYKPGGGPLFDMGPYYLTALINSLGSVNRVAAITGRAFAQRTITSQPKNGEIIDVEVDTHTAGTLEFSNGAIITLVMSFDVWGHTHHNIELHGLTASMSVPDPNGFGGTVRIRRGGQQGWEEQALTHGYTENMRSIGLADMCMSIRSGRTHRAGAELAFHVLEVMEAFERSSKTNEHIQIESRVERPDPLPLDLAHGELD